MCKVTAAPGGWAAAGTVAATRDSPASRAVPATHRATWKATRAAHCTDARAAHAVHGGLLPFALGAQVLDMDRGDFPVQAMVPVAWFRPPRRRADRLGPRALRPYGIRSRPETVGSSASHRYSYSPAYEEQQ